MNKKRELVFGLGILFLCALGILFLNLKTKNDLEYEKSIDNKFLDTAILQSLEKKNN